LDVFAKCLEYLKNVATDTVNARHLKSKRDNPAAEPMYKPSQIQWVITIPAIWSVTAKKFMRKAAYKVTLYSQISHSLTGCRDITFHSESDISDEDRLITMYD